MSEELAARLMARIAVPPMPFAPDTYTAGRMDQFTEMITQLRALPEVDKEQALADAKARIGRLAAPNGSYGEAEWGFLRGVTAALAALTQPQTEIHINSESEPSDEDKAIVGDLVNRAVERMKPDGGGAATAAGVPDGDLVARAMAVFNSHIEAERDLEHGGMICSECGFHLGDLPVLHTTRQDHAFRMAFDATGQLIGDSDGPCPACSGLESDGGGAATAAGVPDADLVRVGDFFGLPAFTHPDVKPGIVGIVSAGEVTATITGTAPQRPGDAIKKEES